MKKIPKKNYIILGVLAVLVVLLVWYIGQWIEAYKFNKLGISIISESINTVNKNELEVSLAETNQIILYVGYTHNNEIRNFEKELLKRIKSKNLNEFMIYYNITDELEDDEYLESLRKQFKNLSPLINKAPMFIYVKNSEGIEVKDSNETMITVKDYDELILKYEIGQ